MTHKRVAMVLAGEALRGDHDSLMVLADILEEAARLDLCEYLRDPSDEKQVAGVFAFLLNKSPSKVMLGDGLKSILAHSIMEATWVLVGHFTINEAEARIEEMLRQSTYQLIKDFADLVDVEVENVPAELFNDEATWHAHFNSQYSQYGGDFDDDDFDDEEDEQEVTFPTAFGVGPDNVRNPPLTQEGKQVWHIYVGVNGSDVYIGGGCTGSRVPGFLGQMSIRGDVVPVEDVVYWDAKYFGTKVPPYGKMDPKVAKKILRAFPRAQATQRNLNNNDQN